MLHRIGEATKREPLASLLRGTLIADEAWIDGKDSTRHADKHNPASGSGVTDRPPGMALVDFETREARWRAVSDATGVILAGVIEENVDLPASQLWPDGSGAKRTIGAQMSGPRRTIDHNIDECKRDGATTNSAEGYVSQLKRSIDGTHHHVSVDHLPRYPAQFEFLFSNCGEADSQPMRRLLGPVEDGD